MSQSRIIRKINAVLAIVTMVPLLAMAQQSGASTEGIYTTEQARQGRQIYAARCAACHAENLMGATASPIVGPQFVQRWGGVPPAADEQQWQGFKVEDLFFAIRTTMPPGESGLLELGDQVVVLAYILEQNGFPAGRLSLEADSPILKRTDLAFKPLVTEIVPAAAPRLEKRQLVWVDRQGREEPLPLPVRHYYLPRLSPDGRQVAVEVHQDKPDIWVVDIGTGDSRQVTLEGGNRFPLWSPDGQRILFSSDRHQETPEGFFADHDVYSKAADGSGEAQRLTFGEHNHGPQKFTPDGKTLSFYEIHPTTYRDVWMLPLEGGQEPWVFLQTPHLEGGIGFSQDGHWMAHTSKETGRYEIVIRGFPDAEPMRQITSQGGVEVLWPLGSPELFYRNGNQRMAVEVATSPTLKIGTPRVLFEGDFVSSPGSRANWDSVDGLRFLLVKRIE